MLAAHPDLGGGLTDPGVRFERLADRPRQLEKSFFSGGREHAIMAKLDSKMDQKRRRPWATRRVFRLISSIAVRRARADNSLLRMWSFGYAISSMYL